MFASVCRPWPQPPTRKFCRRWRCAPSGLLPSARDHAPPPPPPPPTFPAQGTNAAVAATPRVALATAQLPAPPPVVGDTAAASETCPPSRGQEAQMASSSAIWAPSLPPPPPLGHVGQFAVHAATPSATAGGSAPPVWLPPPPQLPPAKQLDSVAATPVATSSSSESPTGPMVPPPPPPMPTQPSEHVMSGKSLLPAAPRLSVQLGLSEDRSSAALASYGEESPQELLQAIRVEGPRRGLARRWHRLEALHQAGEFNCAQIADLFDQCSRAQTIDGASSSSAKHGETPELPLSTRVVQLFSNFVCENIPELSPKELTTFVIALTSNALPMDEFWLFMMAKRVQDTAADFTPEQVVTIARQYAKKELEDDEFFRALAERILAERDMLQTFGAERLANFLLSCARLRYRHDELLNATFPLFENPSVVATLTGDTLVDALNAAASLDEQSFNPLACCKRLLEAPSQLRFALNNVDHIMGLTLACVSLQSSVIYRRLLPQLLAQLSRAVADRSVQSKRGWSDLGRIHRRVVMLGLCGALGIPRRCAWPFLRLRAARDVLNLVESRFSANRRAARDAYEPASSSFHLEVAAVLRLLNVDHKMEHKQRPFCLDLVVFPDAFAAASLETEGVKASPSAAYEIPLSPVFADL